MGISSLATKYQFENFGTKWSGTRNASAITTVVVHHQAGTNFDNMPGVWKNVPASAHYGIGQDGTIRAYIDELKTAWHAGPANSYAIGIECTNTSLAPNWQVAEKTIDSLVRLIQDIEKRLGRKVQIIGHSDVMATNCPGPFLYPCLGEIRNRVAGSGSTATPTPAPNPSQTLKSNDTIANEVIAGKWGNGADRERRLREAGYNPQTIQALVNQNLGASSAKPTPAPQPSFKSIATIAQEVINGQWGNGADREKRLKAAGYDPKAVQAEVNRRLGASSAPKPAGKTVDQLAREVISGDWGNEPQRSQRLRAAGHDASAVQRRVNQLL